MDSETPLCLACGQEYEAQHLWCFDDLGGIFRIHDRESCWPRDRRIYNNLDREYPRVSVARREEIGQYFVYESATPCPLPNQLMANGSTFEKEWVLSPGPFGDTHEIDVFVVTASADLLPLCENLQWRLMNSCRTLRGTWDLVPTQLRARKLSRLQRESRKASGEEA